MFVYLCEVVKSVLVYNVVVVILVYNYFFGVVELLWVDEMFIYSLKEVFVMVDVKFFDYFIVVGNILLLLFVEWGLL